MNREKRAYSLFVVLLFALGVKAQGPANHPMVVQPNVLSYADNLKPFFQLLYLLEKKQVHQISVLHIGDSHIQADLLSRQVRIGLQGKFGNSGRGLVFPYKQAGSNGPPSTRSASNTTWEAGRNVQPAYRSRTGVAGFYLNTTNQYARLTLRTNNADSVDYNFNHLGIIYNSGPDSFSINVGDTAKPSNYVDASTNQISPGFVSLKMPALTNYVVLENDKPNADATHMQYYGFIMENESPGIVYHVAGVNGAQYGNYANAPLFAPQTKALGPQLIIISLGTNEAFGAKFDSLQMVKDIDSLVTHLQDNNPWASFILTTPPDVYKRRKYYNANIKKMSDIIDGYAKANGLAVWNMFDITGGYTSAKNWRKYRLLAGDGVHFQHAGYKLQGQLLLDAILKAYDEYKMTIKK